MATKFVKRLTPDVRHVLTLAQTVAERRQYLYVEPEHLLFGLMQGSYVASRLFLSIGLDPTFIESFAKQMLPVAQRAEDEPLILSDASKKILELAAHQAKSQGSRQIGVTHLVLAAIDETSVVFTQLVERLQLDPDSVRHQLLRMLKNKDDPAIGPSQLRTPGYYSRVPPNYLASRWRLILIYAIAEAKRLKQREVGVQHLLFALTCEQTDGTAQLLQSVGLTQDVVRGLLPQEPSPDFNPDLDVEFSSALREVFGFATEEAFKQGINHLCTQHLLLGILRQKESAAIDILRQHNIDLDELEKATRKSLL